MEKEVPGGVRVGIRLRYNVILSVLASRRRIFTDDEGTAVHRTLILAQKRCMYIEEKKKKKDA